MTHVHNDPATFKEDAITGFAHAYARYVTRVPGAAGFVRAAGPRRGKVSLVVGGGSGHYPSYAGIVGAGFADGCVLGDVFTSPSTRQIYRVARAAHGDAGVVLAFGNYAGDRLNFAAARELLLADGIDTRIVYVTDDVASAPAGEAPKRRGIAGTATVYKIGGSAADTGADLDRVESVMRRANDATRSFGVAFGGCTLPGASGPLFTVAPDRMEFGLGIHGEPGVRSSASMPAAALAAELVHRVLAERAPTDSGRAAVLLNGLGATKYEELFVLWGAVAPLLDEAGVECVLPEVGELVTSLDMAGCSLSVTWLDDELEEHWTAPVDTAAFRRGTSVPAAGEAVAVRAAPVEDTVATTASAASRADAAVACRVLAGVAEAIADHEGELGRLDAVAGDGDHGAGMVRGTSAALAAAEQTDGGLGQLLDAAGTAFADRAGGTSGALWGLFLRAVGASVGNEEALDGARLIAALTAGADAIQRAGGAQLGDKTLLDALLPFVAELGERVAAGEAVAPAWQSAARTAVEAAQSTADLVARVGRARPLAERSLGTPDPGAVSAGLLLNRAGEVIAGCAARPENALSGRTNPREKEVR